VPLTGKGTIKYIRGVIGVAGAAQFCACTDSFSYFLTNRSTPA